MGTMSQVFAPNLAALCAAIAETCAHVGREPASVGILPVTKNQPPEAIAHVVAAGLTAVGENRVQEAREKRAATSTTAPGLHWELIGHLQSNKVRLAVTLFDRIQSVDSPKLVDLLDRAAADCHRVVPILLQVNAGRDPAKFGCDLESVPALLERALGRPHLRVEGLMAIAPLADDASMARQTFVTLRETRDALATRFGVKLAELSMGMSGDWREAVVAGSTQIRIGTGLFGPRA